MYTPNLILTMTLCIGKMVNFCPPLRLNRGFVPKPTKVKTLISIVVSIFRSQTSVIFLYVLFIYRKIN